MKHRYNYTVNKSKIVYVRGSRPIFNSSGKAVGYSRVSYPLVANFSETRTGYKDVPIIGIAKIVMLILVLFLFASVLYGRDVPVSFTTFFNALQYVPTIDMSKVFDFTQSLRIPLNSVPFGGMFFAQVFNTFFAPVLSFLIFLNVCVVQLLAFVGFFIYFVVYGVYVV